MPDPGLSAARRLLLDLGSLSLANILGKLLWALSLALAMRLLGTEQYGELVVIWSLAGLLAPQTDLGLSQLLLREGARRADVIPALLRAALIARIALGLAIVLLLGLSADAGWSSLDRGMIMLAALGPIVDAAFLTATPLAQAEHRIRLLSGWRVLSFATLPALLWLVWRADGGIGGVALAWVIAASVGLAGFFLMRGQATGVETRVADWRSTLTQALPFLLMGMAAMSYGKLEVIILGTMTDPRQAALYHAAYQVLLLTFSAGDLFFAAIFAGLYRAQAQPARLARYWPSISRLLVALVVLALPMLWWHAELVMALVGGPEFAEAGAVLRGLLPMVAMMPMAGALHLLTLLDRPALRASLDGACVLLTAGIAAVGAEWLQATGLAWFASGVYLLTCLVAWRIVRNLGLELRWLGDLGRAVLSVSLALPVLALPLTWWLSCAAYAAAACLLLAFFGCLGWRDLRMLGEHTGEHG